RRDAQSGEALSVERLVAGLPVGGAKLEVLDVREGCEEPVGDGSFRVEVQVVRVAVGARAFAAQPGREPQLAIQQQQLFLEISSAVVHALELLPDGDVGGGAETALAGHQVASHHPHQIQVPALVLEAPGGGGEKIGARRRPVVHQVYAQVVVQV